jgi:hypothetical protein
MFFKSFSNVHFSFMKIDKSIDIVYLWVNGNDPVWQRKRHHAVEKLSPGNLNAIAMYGNVEGRFRDNDELRYSLRALERYFPEHGHVYVVTDDQAPAWLCPSDRLTVVDHKELIPAESLPTFDSGNIESYIHRIPNLSERYFYLNDDVFFSATVNLRDWFWDGGIYVTWSDEPVVTDEPLREDATSLENACRLSSQWFGSRTEHLNFESELVTEAIGQYRHTFRTFAHSPRPMLRSFLLELERLAPDMFDRVRSTVFRTWDKPTVVSDFVMRWALATGVAKARDYRHLYVTTGDASMTNQLDHLVSQLGFIDFFCINDTTDDAETHDPRLTKVREAFQEMFPYKSRFERSATEVQFDCFAPNTVAIKSSVHPLLPLSKYAGGQVTANQQ